MKKSVGFGIVRLGLLLLLAAAVVLAAGACKKSVPPSTNDITPLQTLVNTDTSMSYFHRLVLTGNVNGLLADDSITLLIPTNDAFRAAGYLIDSIGSTDAGRVVQYHCLRAIARPTDVNAVGYTSALPGFTVYGLKDGNGTVLFNAAPATGEPQQVGKALVYRLSSVMTPPADSLKPLLTNDSSISYFAHAMSRTGLDTLLSSGSYTFLAPINSAFNAAGYDSLGAVDSADVTVLTQLAKNQIVADIWFTNMLAGVPSVTTIGGLTVTITQSNGVSGTLQFAGSGNAIPANLVRSNQLAGNNIIFHRIDQVLR